MKRRKWNILEENPKECDDHSDREDKHDEESCHFGRKSQYTQTKETRRRYYSDQANQRSRRSRRTGVIARKQKLEREKLNKVTTESFAVREDGRSEEEERAWERERRRRRLFRFLREDEINDPLWYGAPLCHTHSSRDVRA